MQSIGARLLSAAKFVRQGAYFADIGTDHAHLPLFLLGEGVISHAVSADVNQGPLDSAVRNSAEAGFSDRITFILTDGASGLANMGITDYALCGMGGELIRDIIESSPHLKSPGIRLILQPMTKQATLRKYLANAGFLTVGESYSCEAGQYYLCLAVEYSGETKQISEFEAEFGELFFGDELSYEKEGYFNTRIKAIKKAIAGKKKSGQDTSPLDAILSEYEERTGK